MSGMGGGMMGGMGGGMGGMGGMGGASYARSGISGGRDAREEYAGALRSPSASDKSDEEDSAEQFNANSWSARAMARTMPSDMSADRRYVHLFADEAKPAYPEQPSQPYTPAVTPIVRRFTSLDVTLPTLGEQGREYLFSSPQGDLELSARYVPADWTERGTLLAYGLGTWVLLLAFYRCATFLGRKRRVVGR